MHRTSLHTATLRRPARRLHFEPLERKELLAGWVANSVSVAGNDPGTSLALDGAGNAYVAGYFSGTMSWGGATLTSRGGVDMFITKVDPSGNFVWTKSAGGTQTDVGRGIAVDGGGNVYVTGLYQGQATFGSITLQAQTATTVDAFFAKLDPQGNFLWAKRASNAEGFAIAADAAGNVYVAGAYSSPAEFDGVPLPSYGGGDRFVAGLNAADGSTRWVTARGGPNFDPGTGLAVNSQGSLLYATWTDNTGQPVLSKLDPSTGQIIWDHPASLDGYQPWEGRMAIADDGATMSIYVTSEAGGGGSGGTLTKYTDAGTSANFQWRRDGMYATSLATDAAGDVYGTGAVLYLDWSAQDFDPGPGRAVLTSYDNSLVSWIWKLDSGGNFVSVRASGFGEPDLGPESSEAIALDAAGNIYTTGGFVGTATKFDTGSAYPGPSPSTSQGMFLLKTTQDTGGILGFAFNDFNNNGVWDFTDQDGNGRWNGSETGEPSLVGATVYIDANNNGQLDSGEPTEVTRALGEYRFPHVAPGDHTVRLVPPAGFSQSFPAAGAAHTVTVSAGEVANDVDFGAHPPIQTKTYTSTDVPKKYPARGWQENYSNLTIADSYPVFGIDVSVSVSSNLVGLSLIAPDGTRVVVAPGVTHINAMNYKNVSGTWKLAISKQDPWPNGSVTAWSMTVVGQAPPPPPPPPAGVTVSPTSGLQTTEQGGSATFTVVLNRQPTANVSIGVSSSDTTEGLASVSNLVFTPTNWNVARTVTVTGVDDTIRDGNIAYTVLLAAALSSDPAYNGLNPSDVAVTNIDNEKGKIGRSASPPADAYAQPHTQTKHFALSAATIHVPSARLKKSPEAPSKVVPRVVSRSLSASNPHRLQPGGGTNDFELPVAATRASFTSGVSPVQLVVHAADMALTNLFDEETRRQ